MSNLVHLEPIYGDRAYVLRVYEPGYSFEASSPYQASATVEVTGSTARVYGMSGNAFTAAQYRDFLRQLAERGIDRLEYTHNGRPTVVRYLAERWQMQPRQ